MNLNFGSSKVSQVPAGLDVKGVLPQFEKTSYHLIIKAGLLKITHFAAGFLKKVGANIYDPEAIVYELPTKDIFLEFARKVRVIVRGIQALFAFGYLLDPIKHKMFFFQNLSHRLLRWLAPFFLIVLLFFKWIFG